MIHDAFTLRLESNALPQGAVLVAEVKGREAVSQLFDFEILAVLTGDGPLDPDGIAGAEAALVLERGGREVRRVSGMIAAVEDHLDTETAHLAYRLRLVPRAFRLTLQETLDIHMDLTLPELIAKKLEAWGFVAKQDFDLRLYDEYPRREFIVQYKETDLAFLSRVTEHLGVSFFFEQAGDRDVLVFTDRNDGFRPVEGSETATFRARGERRDVFRFESSTRVVPAQYVVRDYNYRTPGVDLIAAAATRAPTGGRIIEYGAHFKTQEEGDRLARIRLEEQLSMRRVYKGESDLPTMAAGSRRTLLDHPAGDVDLVLTEVRHTARQAVLGHAVADGPAYSASFCAVRSDQPYRPPRVTPRPRVNGVLTGVIDSASRGQYAELDSDGRYKVKFLFDTAERGEGQASRPVRMLQPHAGPGYGMHFPLRTGVEVALTFVDGDPDRPMIAGTAPNPQTSSPVTASNAERNIIRTGGGNEINIDDTEDSQRIKLSTPHSDTVFQLGKRNAPEDGAILTTHGANTAVAGAGFSAFGLFGATFNTVMDFLYSHVVLTVASFPGIWEFATLGGQMVDGLLGITQAGLDAALNHMIVQEKEKIEKAKDAIVAADAAQKDCDACRLRARAELSKLKAQLSTAQYDALTASLDGYDSACHAADSAYLSLIGVMEDRNGIIMVNREGGNLNFEKVMQNDCDAALADYDLDAYIAQKQAQANAQWKVEWLAAEKVKNPQTTVTENDAPSPPDADWMGRQRDLWSEAARDSANQRDTFGAEYDALSDAEKQTAGSRKDYVDAKMKGWADSPEKVGPVQAKKDAESALLSQIATKDPSTGRWTAKDPKYAALLKELTCDACTSLDTKRQASIDRNNEYAAQLKEAYGTEAQDVRRAKIAIDNARAGVGGINMIISAITAIIGLVERFKAKAKLAARWAAGGTVLTDSATRSTAPGIGLTAHAALTGRPMHVVGADKSMEVYGEEDVVVWAKTALILGKGRKSADGKVIITAADSVRVTSPNEVEIAGKAKVLVSGKDVDIVGDDTLKLKAKHRVGLLGTGTLSAIAEDEMTLESEAKNITLTASAASKKIQLTAEAKIQGDTKDVELNVTQAAQILAGNWYMKVKADANGHAKLGSDDWQLFIKANRVELGSDDSGLTATNQFSRLKFSQTVVKLEQNRALVSSHGTVQLTGQTVKANGKVLLG